LRVLFADQYAQPGGAQLCLREVMEEARGRGWETHLMTPASGLPESMAAYGNGSKSVRDLLAFGPDTIRAALAMRRVIRRHQIDLVYANGPRVLPAAALAGGPLLFHAHSYLGTAYARAIAGRCIRARRATVFAASNFVAGPLRKMRCAAEIRVIYNGIADQTFFARSFASPALTIGIVGRIAPEKGHLDFVRAAHGIAAAYPATRFVVYGAPLFSGDRYECEVRRAAFGLNLEFKGWTEPIAEALHSIDILAVPSASIESLPRVIPEALSAGTPVVAYASGGIPELMRPRQTCLLTAAPDSEALASAFRELLRDRQKMRWLAVNGRLEWERRFRLERFQREVCDALQQVVERSADLPDPAHAVAGERA